MPKAKGSNASKVNFILQDYPDEFTKNPNNELYCKLCSCTVKCDKRFLVESHRKTSKHQKALRSRSALLTPHTSQTFLKSIDQNFGEKVTKAFLSADIPLYKLNNEHIKKLFQEIGHSLPSETTCRKTVLKLGTDELLRVRSALDDKKIFLVVDESTLSGTPYLNILVGNIELPHITYMYDCQPLTSAPTSDSISQAVDDAVRSLGTNRNSFCLLLSDAARYMVAAGTILKSLYPKLFHVTCIAHLLHNCAMKVKSQFQDVDQVIAKVKAATVKNKTRQAKFTAIGYPPQPVVTRWGSWLQAALYYAKHLPEVKTIVEHFEGSGILVTQAKVSLQTPDLAVQLLKIKQQYESLVSHIEALESAKYSIKEAVQAIQELNFEEDSCGIKPYITKRMQKNDISKIMRMERPDISPAEYCLLQHCQPTSASVERSFSMLRKLLAKDRNFKGHNVKHYIVLHFNSSTW